MNHRPTFSGGPQAAAPGATDPRHAATSRNLISPGELGRRIRQTRLEQRMTLKQMEKSCDLSATHISEIERGRTSPTVGALTRLARALGRDAAYFMDVVERAEVSHVVAGTIPRTNGTSGLTVEPLSRGIPGSRIFPYRLRLEPTTIFQLAARATSSAAYTIEHGRVELTIGTRTLSLASGDTAHGTRDETHALRAGSDDTAVVLAVLSQPVEARMMFYAPANGNASHEAEEYAAVPNESVDPTPREIGRRIKLLRIGRGLTLKEIEHRGGISATHVSEIERGKASPTVGVLARIGHALDVEPSTLIEPKLMPDVSSASAAEAASQRVRWGHATIDPLTAPIDGAEFGLYRLSIPVGTDAALTHRHPGEEWAMVVRGVIEVRTKGETHTLREGDTLHFNADHEHAYVNPTSTPVELVIATRPRFVL